jgi:hypothetical protein
MLPLQHATTEALPWQQPHVKAPSRLDLRFEHLRLYIQNITEDHYAV